MNDFDKFILEKYDEGLSIEEIAKQVPYSSRDVASVIFFNKRRG